MSQTHTHSQASELNKSVTTRITMYQNHSFDIWELSKLCPTTSNSIILAAKITYTSTSLQHLMTQAMV